VILAACRRQKDTYSYIIYSKHCCSQPKLPGRPAAPVKLEGMAIPQHFITELLARADVVEVVGRHVQLKKAGANFSGLCPFHGEKTPSFTVSPSKQFFHCFGCGKNGNALGFIMEHTGANFVEAVQDLAQQYGMPVPEDERSPEERTRDKDRRAAQQTLTDVLEKAAHAYQAQLKNAPRAIDYLKGRGLSGQIAKRFGLGYAPEGWRGLASVFAEYDDPKLVECGLVIARSEDENNPQNSGGEVKKYDRFRDRVMFPIRNVKGECIGFGGRILDKGEPKYLNSPETPVFSKGRELYGLFEAREHLQKAGYVLVTEGYMDVVALAQHGFPNAVATLGTACTGDHVQKLFRFTDNVVFSFDGDGAGRRAARKALDAALPFATDTRSARFLFLPPEHDPDSYIREHGHDGFSRYVSNAIPLSQFLLDAAREGCDPSSMEGRSRMATQAKTLWFPLPDGALKRQLLREIASLVQLGERELADLWQPKQTPGNTASYKKDSYQASTNAGNRPFSPWKSKNQPEAPRFAVKRAVPTRVDHALRALLLNAQWWEQLTQEDHHMLCEQAAPLGPAFVWLDAMVHEHGPQPWAALSAELQGHPSQQYVLAQLAAADELAQAKSGPAPNAPTPSAETSFDELRSLLNLELAQWLKAQESNALKEFMQNPEARSRYEAIVERRKALAQIKPLAS
jgi:DNA primase